MEKGWKECGKTSEKLGWGKGRGPIKTGPQMGKRERRSIALKNKWITDSEKERTETHSRKIRPEMVKRGVGRGGHGR